MSREESIERLTTGRTWEEYCDALKLAGQVILRESAPADPRTRAEGFRYLSRLSRAACEAFLEHSDPRTPVLFRPVHETVKMGADHPDNHYLWARISGEHAYVLRGRRNTVAYLGFGTYAGFYGGEGRRAETGTLEGSSLHLDPEGSFTVHVARERPAGAVDWLPLAADSEQLIVRQTFLDREIETPVELSIERVGGDARPTPFDPVAIDEGFTMAGRLVTGAAALFANWAEDFQAHVNELPRFDPQTSLAAGGDPNIAYYHSYWRLAPEEALVVEATPPRCEHWNFQLNNHWMESLDYRYHRVAINKHSAAYEPDGSVRIVVAHEDPGLPNWLETVGHGEGTMCFRWVRADAHPQPRARVVALDELRRGRQG